MCARGRGPSRKTQAWRKWRCPLSARQTLSLHLTFSSWAPPSGWGRTPPGCWLLCPLLSKQIGFLKGGKPGFLSFPESTREGRQEAAHSPRKKSGPWNRELPQALTTASWENPPLLWDAPDSQDHLSEARTASPLPIRGQWLPDIRRHHFHSYRVIFEIFIVIISRRVGSFFFFFLTFYFKDMWSSTRIKNVRGDTWIRIMPLSLKMVQVVHCTYFTAISLKCVLFAEYSQTKHSCATHTQIKKNYLLPPPSPPSLARGIF